MTLTDRDVDFVAYDDGGRPVLLVEVKNRRHTSDVWAAQFRRNLLVDGTLPTEPYFLIATPDRMYFWRRDSQTPNEELPHFTLDAVRELKPYFEDFRQSSEQIDAQALKLILYSWLVDLAESGKLRAQNDSYLEWLSRSGLLEALTGARIEVSAGQ